MHGGPGRIFLHWLQPIPTALRFGGSELSVGGRADSISPGREFLKGDILYELKDQVAVPNVRSMIN
mgnify:CR=1 FL=1